MDNVNINVVTGATGHIGVALCIELKGRGEYIRAAVLKGERYDYIVPYADEIVFADVTDYGSLLKCFEGADTVYHLAGIITIGKENQDILRAVNVGGTVNVINACKECGIKNLVYTSSVHAIDFKTKKEVLREKPLYNPGAVKGHYAATKAEAANLVIKANGKELRTVVCMPSGVTGPYAYKRSNIGQMILDFADKKLTAYMEGSYNYVDVRDVAGGLYTAAKKGRGGESYVLSGEEVSIKQMMVYLEEITGVKAPKFKIAVWFLKIFAGLSELYYRIRKVKPLFTSYSIYTLNSNCNFDNGKAKAELNFNPRGIKKSLADEAAFMAKNEDLRLTGKTTKVSVS